MTAGVQMPNWKVTVNDGPTKIVPASNIMVAMHRGLERIGLIDTKIEKLEVRRVRRSRTELESSKLLESNAVAEKEGFEPSKYAKSTPEPHGIHREGRRHG